MKFSQRIGKTPIRQSLQIGFIDTELSNRLWNAILVDYLFEISSYSASGTESKRMYICKIIWTEFFANRIDEFPTDVFSHASIEAFIHNLKDWFFKASWFEKYDLVEFICRMDNNITRSNFAERSNDVLSRTSAGYRIIDNKLVQITSEEEIAAIEDALNRSSKNETVEVHLRTALGFLSNRDKPDYRNSIKESISAVESMCVKITGDKNATLGAALKQIEERFQIHGALKKAFSALYGYTSDSGGIRHSLLEDDIEVTMEDAKFMLVACSAFVNYLKIKK